MKRIIALVSLALIAMFSFVGCGENADNAASEAGQLVTDAADTVSQAADDMMDNSNGDVTNNSNETNDTNDTNNTDDANSNGNVSND